MQRDEVARGDSRRQRNAIHRGKRQHRHEKRKLQHQHSAVFGSNQMRQIANEQPGIDEAGHDQNRHACDCQVGKAPDRARRHLDGCDRRSAACAGEQKHKTGQRTEPGARREEVRHVGTNANVMIGALPGRRVSCERKHREIAGSKHHGSDQRRAPAFCRGAPVINEDAGERDGNCETPHPRASECCLKRHPTERVPHCRIGDRQSAHQRHFEQKPRGGRHDANAERCPRDRTKAEPQSIPFERVAVRVGCHRRWQHNEREREAAEQENRAQQMRETNDDEERVQR